VTVAGVLGVVLGAVLVGAAVAKLAGGARSRDALRSFGLRDRRVRASVWAATIVVEAGLGAAVATGSSVAAMAAAGLLATYAVILTAAIARGRAGAPCGCLGAHSRISWVATARTAAFACGFAVLPWLPNTSPSTDAWLTAGLILALCGVAVLAVALLALARELGELRLSLAPQAALSLDHEGPELGSRTALADRFQRDRALALAVFTSTGCALCEALAPAVRLVSTDPAVEVEILDEEHEPGLWASLAIPGSPYGVVLARDGTVVAKGSFNTLPQLEGLLASAERRAREPVRA